MWKPHDCTNTCKYILSYRPIALADLLTNKHPQMSDSVHLVTNSDTLQPFTLEYSDLTVETPQGEWVLDDDLVQQRYYSYLKRNKPVSNSIITALSNVENNLS